MLLALIAAVSAAGTQTAPSIRDLVQMADISSVAISPDGRSIGFQERTPSIARNRTSTTWYVVPSDASAPAKPVADGGDALWEDPGIINSDPPIWSADSRFFYFRALIGEEIQVWRASRDGDPPIQITHDPADVRNITLSTDGSHLRYTIGSTRQEIRDAEQSVYDGGVRIDGTVAVGQNLFRSAWHDGKLITTRLDRDWFGKRGLLDDRPDIERLINLSMPAGNALINGRTSADEKSLDLSRFVDVAKATVKAVSLEGRRVAFVSNGSGGGRLAAYTEDGLLRTCASRDCTGARIVALAWRPGHSEILFTTMDAAKAQSLFLWNVARGGVRSVYHGRGLLDAGDDDPSKPCAVGREIVVCVASSADAPPRLVEISLSSGKERMLYDPNPAMTAMRGIRIETLRWQDPQGHRFTGQLAMPRGVPSGRRAPLFITYYVCDGFLRGGLGNEWPLFPLAASGVAALCINATHPDVANYDAEENYGVALTGVRAAIELLDKRGLIDPARVGMGGLSFGSEVTMWTALHSNLLAAASTASPTASEIYYWMNAIDRPEFTENLRKVWKLGPPNDQDPQWRRLASEFHIADLQIPLLIQSPEHEYRFEAEFLAKALAAGKPVEMYAFADAPHLKIQPRQKLAAYERNLAWFTFWLKGSVLAQYSHPDEVARWQKMKANAPHF